MRRLAATLGALATLLASAVAGEPDAARYAIEPSVDGFVRLDTETGALSHCTRRDGIWRCAVLTEDRSAIDALAADVSALADGLAALTARVATLEATPPPTTADGGRAVESSFAATLMERLILFVRDIRQLPSGQS
ncbi:MAG: hypothetical protein GY798_11565 [Hyphomicrobiales bacterium]|nr:hypothetical protein [Hyphomicrobiales bacterium]